MIAWHARKNDHVIRSSVNPAEFLISADYFAQMKIPESQQQIEHVILLPSDYKRDILAPSLRTRLGFQSYSTVRVRGVFSLRNRVPWGNT